MMRITINGSLGSGKSTVGKLLASKLGIEHLSTGDMFRQIGQIKNMDALNTNLAAEKNYSIDERVDSFSKELANSGRDFVIDSRMAWKFIPDAFNIYLTASLENAVSRILSDNSRKGEAYQNREDAKKSIVERRASELKRYEKIYGVNIDDPNNYDCLVVTDDASPDDVVELLLQLVSKKENSAVWLPKSRLVPMIGIREASGLTMEEPVNLVNTGPYAVYVEDNFGFFQGAARDLAEILFGQGKFFRVTDSGAGFMQSHVGEMLSFVLTHFKLGHFYDWEEVGQNSFAISRYYLSPDALAQTNK